MEKAYNPHSCESTLYPFWEKNGYFKPKGHGEAFSMVAPPPNVTGVLHMGHALNWTLQDVVVRHLRMKGHDVLWVPGMDHAGIATQNVVEKQLAKENTSRHDLGRKAFIDRVWTWKEEYGGKILSQIRRLGASVDWDHERFTMDAQSSRAVTETFVNLYERGLIYKGSYIINWDTQAETALSDVEVIHKEEQGHMWVFRYPLADANAGYLEIATTRPETLLGDTAVAVNPNDDRYKNLIGKTLILPLANREIPIVGDDHVDPAFGTGAVKVTPAHDPNDYEIGQRHHLDAILIMDTKGKMNQNVPAEYQGLDRFECRKAVIAAMDAQGLLVEIKDHTLSRAYSQRTDTVVEPYLSDQWFVSMKGLAKAAIEVVKSGQIEFIPNRFEKLYFDWMENIRDWCISRQIWWGHRIPVYYCESCGNDPIVTKNPLESCSKCGGVVRQDPDVLDTWFSSALWPFSTLGWPKDSDTFKRYYPTSFLVTGYDIITFWVSRMITIGLSQTDQIPFSKVYIHGLVRDISGKKMSKSLGNVVDPLKLIEQYGTDALRFSMASLATLGGQDVRFSEDKIEACRNFANKLWNASRFIHMNLDQMDAAISLAEPTPKTLSDQWILSRFNETVDALNAALSQHNFASATEILWEFAWNTLCDWAVEMAKLNKQESLPVLVYVLLNTLKLCHPFMPYLTEEIWQRFKDTGKIIGMDDAIMIASWPTPRSEWRNVTADNQMALAIKVIRELRNVRHNLNISPAKSIPVIMVADSDDDIASLKAAEGYIQLLAKVTDIQFERTGFEKPSQSAGSVVGSLQLYIPLSGVIDIDQEIARLSKKLEGLEKELATVSSRLENKAFVEKAPDHVVQKMKDQQETLATEQASLKVQLAQLA